MKMACIWLSYDLIISNSLVQTWTLDNLVLISLHNSTNLALIQRQNIFDIILTDLTYLILCKQHKIVAWECLGPNFINMYSQNFQKHVIQSNSWLPVLCSSNFRHHLIQVLLKNKLVKSKVAGSWAESEIEGFFIFSRQLFSYFQPM